MKNQKHTLTILSTLLLTTLSYSSGTFEQSLQGKDKLGNPCSLILEGSPNNGLMTTSFDSEDLLTQINKNYQENGYYQAGARNKTYKKTLTVFLNKKLEATHFVYQHNTISIKFLTWMDETNEALEICTLM